MIAPEASTAGNDGADLIGLIASFLGPPSSNVPDGADDNKSSSSPALSSRSTSGKGCDVDSELSPPSFESILAARVVVFSKDRPWQLQQLLRSMQLTERISNRHHCKPVIYTIVRASTPAFAEGYERVTSEFKGVHFLAEEEEKSDSFSSLLHEALTHGTSKGVDEIVMFLTDDCVLLEPLEGILAVASGAMSQGNAPSSSKSTAQQGRVFNFITRLHPGISWCQTRNAASPPPRDEIRYHSLSKHLNNEYCEEGDDGDTPSNHHGGVYLYNRRKCSGEWAYHFDLSGGVYHLNDVMFLLSHMKPQWRSHPNMLEMMANRLLKASKESAVSTHLDQTRKDLSAIPTRPVLVIIAVNRVQDVCNAPLATPRESANEITVDASDPASLLDLLDGSSYDINRYRQTVYNASHIGDFFLKKGTACDEVVSSMNRPKVSVLIPVHTGPPEAASHAIVSVIMQPLDECKSMRRDKRGEHYSRATLSPMQIVLVDDRCSDGSVDKMIKACREVLRAHDDVSLTVRDHRAAKIEHETPQASDQGISISVDIVGAPQAGVACALNHGLGFCRADYVARMDADDVCAPGRLLSQLNFMNANPSFAAVGTSTVLFAAYQDAGIESLLPYAHLIETIGLHSALRPSLSISDPGFLAWAMCFTCALVHPSVVYRKKTIQEIGGYDESILRSEDYDLWLRLLQQDIRSIICLPFLGLYHRKHGQSSSSIGSSVQSDESDRAITRMLQSTDDNVQLTIDQVSTMRKPELAETAASLDDAARLLVRLEASFFERHAERLTHEEATLISQDCSSRIGEIATIRVMKFGSKGITQSFAWEVWCERCPDEQMKRISLVCHLNAQGLANE